MSAGPQEITVDADGAGERLDRFLAARPLGLSRTRVRRIIDLGGVYLDGRRMRRCGEVVREGQVVRIFLDDPEQEPFTLTGDHILYRDRYLLALDKPAGVETQPTPARYKGTVYAALCDHLRDPFRPLDKPMVGMVQRLDRETSGVMVFSIHPRANRGLTRTFTERRAGKTYLALVAGEMPEPQGEFRSRLARRRSSNRMQSVTQGGKEAVTRYRVIEALPSGSLVEVQILTGRSHQIRVHFAEAGHPLFGDAKYGRPPGREAWPRQMLHAARLEIDHPVTDVPLIIEAPLPADMRQGLERLRTGK